MRMQRVKQDPTKIMTSEENAKNFNQPGTEVPKVKMLKVIYHDDIFGEPYQYYNNDSII